jgi:desulfoferrodoxin-like iron-binding protein
MKTFICKRCGHIAFDHAPIICPVCNAPIEHYEDNPQALVIPEDSENLHEHEKQHIPVLSVSEECVLSDGKKCIDIHVKVGEVEHVMESEHYITFLDFYLNKRYLARINFTYKRLHPAVSLRMNIDSGGVLTVVEHCTVHGNWMAEVTI